MMQNNHLKTVGVVIATYNGEKFLNEQIQSILNQFKKPEKIVVVDDCSMDTTKDIIKYYMKNFPELFIFIENEKNLGSKKTFEIGIAACDTDYIVLSDQDDIWTPEKISKLFYLLERNENAKLCFHDLAMIDSQGTGLGRNFWEAAPAHEPLPVTGLAARERLVALSNPVPGCTMFFSSGLKNFILPIPPSKWVGHDWWISVIAFFLADPVYVTDTLAFYRLHANQTAGIGTVLKKGKISRNRISLYSKIKREIKRIVNWQKIRNVRKDEIKQRQHDMNIELLRVIKKCETGDITAEQRKEYRLLKEKITHDLATNSS
jgi:glycosyltransferase involved in cell wall biosynthesis